MKKKTYPVTNIGSVSLLIYRAPPETTSTAGILPGTIQNIIMPVIRQR